MNSTQNAALIYMTNTTIIDCKSGSFFFVYSTVVIVDVLFSLPINAWVLWMLARHKGSLGALDILAFVEVVCCLFLLISIPFSWYAMYYSAYVTSNTFTFFVRISRPVFQCCICVERYLAVVHPIIFLKYKGTQYWLPCLAAVWLFVMCISLVSLVIKHSYIYTSIILLVLTIDTFCSLSILRVLKKTWPGDGERQEMNLMKKRAFVTVLVIQAVTAVNFLPLLFVANIAKYFLNYNNFCWVFFGVVAISDTCNYVHVVFYLCREGKLPCTSLFKCRRK